MARTVGLVEKDVEKVENYVEKPKASVKTPIKSTSKVKEILPDGE